MGRLSVGMHLGKFLEKVVRFVHKVGQGESRLSKITGVLKANMGAILRKVRGTVSKGAKMGLTTSKKLFKTAWRNKKLIAKGAVLAGGAAYLSHEASETYEEAKLKCQGTCQGFNNVNLSSHKYDQIVNLLYCRERDHESKPCSSFTGGGNQGGVINMNPCPDACTDIRRGQTSEQETHINSMLYGSCNIKDGDHIHCDYPTYKNTNGTLEFGIIPLDRYTIECDTPPCKDPGKPENELDKQFRDPWHAYAAMRAMEVVEVGGAVGTAAAGMTEMIDGIPGSSILPAVAGATAAATSNALIPDDFPGHCLHKLFEYYTNEDPNDLHDNEEEIKLEEDYKYIRKCIGSDPSAQETNFGPDGDGLVKKCNLETGVVGPGSNNDEYGTCVAWKKTPQGSGKCLPAMHTMSIPTVGGEECLNINTSGDCNLNQYCYWVEDGSEADPNLENIYFCINDKNLIDIHNGILDNDDDLFLIKNTAAKPNQNISGVLDESYESIIAFNKYSGGEGDSKQEIDVGDICNNYCTNYLCHEPFLSMTLLPGMNDIEGSIKKIVNIIIKSIFSLVIGIIVGLSVRSVFFFGLVTVVLGGILILTPVLNDKIDEMLEPRTDEIVKYIIDSDQLLDKLNIFF